MAQDLVPESSLRALTTKRDKGQDGFQGSFRKRVDELNVAHLTSDELAEEPDLLLVSLQYDELLKVDRIATDRLYNVHFSLLPRYKGMYPIVWPLLYGDEFAGVTLHELDARIDGGNIVDQFYVETSAVANAEELYVSCVDGGVEMTLANFPSLLDGSAVGSPQGADGASYNSRSSLDFSRVEIDFRATAFEVRNQVRAFTFPAYQVPTALGHGVDLAEITDSQSTSPPGTVVGDDGDWFEVSTVDFDVRLHRRV